jgi:hypothetical protein
MPGSLNGDPGEELEWPGVEPPAASLSWQDWLGGPVPLGFPPPAYAIGAAAPVTMMPARQLAAKRLCIMIAFCSGARPWRSYTLNTLLSGGEFELRTVAPGCEFAGGATSRATRTWTPPLRCRQRCYATQHIASGGRSSRDGGGCHNVVNWVRIRRVDGGRLDTISTGQAGSRVIVSIGRASPWRRRRRRSSGPGLQVVARTPVVVMRRRSAEKQSPWLRTHAKGFSPATDHVSEYEVRTC